MNWTCEGGIWRLNGRATGGILEPCDRPECGVRHYYGAGCLDSPSRAELLRGVPRPARVPA